MLRVGDASLSLARSIAPKLRESDRNEVFATTGESPEAMVPISFAVSDVCKIIYDRYDEPIMIYGIQPEKLIPSYNNSRSGTIWALGTEGLNREWLPFLRSCKRLAYEASKEGNYALLWNLVWAKSPNIKWLKWMGFQFRDPQPFGPFGEPHQWFGIWSYKLRGA